MPRDPHLAEDPCQWWIGHHCEGKVSDEDIRETGRGELTRVARRSVIMSALARRRGGRDGTRARRLRAGVVTAAICALAAPMLTACSGDEPKDSPPPAQSVAFHVETGRGAGTLSDEARTAVETEVGDVLSNYVVRGFLGEYPREDFIRAFDDFTARTAREAAKDIEELTGARYQDASAVRATRLETRLSVLVLGPDTVGATAAVRFGFEAQVEGKTRPFTLTGRFMLRDEAGTWAVFGYDVARDDGGTAEAEVSP